MARIAEELATQGCSFTTTIGLQDPLIQVLHSQEGSRGSEISTGAAGNSVNNERLQVGRFCVNTVVPQQEPEGGKDWLPKLKLAETLDFLEEPARPTTSFARDFESTMAGSGSGGPLSPESRVGPVFLRLVEGPTDNIASRDPERSCTVIETGQLFLRSGLFELT